MPDDTKLDYEYEVAVNNLTYSHTPDGPNSLADVSFSLPKGSRMIIIGANGGSLRLGMRLYSARFDSFRI